MPIRFGQFELDSRRYELTCEGRVIKLENIPMKLLFFLAENQGTLVSRQTITEHLWGKDVFVDAQHSVNTAINKLRAALSDDLANPRFIQTVKGMGYRFVAEVEIYGAQPPAAAAVTLAQDFTPEAPHESGPETVAPEVRPLWFSKPFGFALLLVIVLAAGGVSFYRLRRSSQLTDKDTIVLADFANSTGNPVFDDALKTALSVSLRQSPFLDVLPESQFAKTLKLMERPADARLTPEATRELCRRVGSKAYVAGSIVSLGSQYVLGLKAVNCRNGDLLAEEQTTAASKERVLDALGRAALKLRAELGESLATVQRFDVPLEQATTSSLEALQAYSKARHGAVPFAERIAYYQRAIELDPNFAMAYVNLGDSYQERGEIGRSRDFFTKAFQLREHASEREKLDIAAEYYQNVTEQLDQAARNYEEEVESYPGAAYLNLGNVYAEQGKYEKAAEVTEQWLRRAPEKAEAYVNLANFYLALQRLDESRQMIRTAQERGIDSAFLHPPLYALAFLNGDQAGMAEQEQRLAKKPENENFGLELASDTAAYFGHLGQARELSQRAIDSAIRTDDTENASVWKAIAAQREAVYGNQAEARRLAAEALQSAPTSQAVESEAALAFALGGDATRAESLARDLQKLFPQGTQMQSIWLAAVHGQLALDRGQPSAAIEALQTTPPLESGQIMFVMNVACLYPAYVRGEAYLAAGQGAAAAAEFQRILDHSGIVWNCWTGAMAHLGMARANALESRTAHGSEADAARTRALAAYLNFFTLWKDADPDIPVLKAAREDYQRLR